MENTNELDFQKDIYQKLLSKYTKYNGQIRKAAYKEGICVGTVAELYDLARAIHQNPKKFEKLLTLIKWLSKSLSSSA